MIVMRKLILALSIFFSWTLVYGQPASSGLKDSLQTVIDQAEGKQKFDYIIYFFQEFGTSDAESCIKLLPNAYKLANTSSELAQVARFYSLVGRAFRFRGSLDSSIIFYDKALYYSQQLADTGSYITLHSQIAKVYTSKGDFSLARANDSLALAYAAAVNDISSVILAKNHIAATYQQQGDFVTSLLVYDSFLDDCPDSLQACKIAMGQKGVALNRTGKPAQALRLFFELRKYQQENNLEVSKAYTDHHIGFLLFQAGLAGEALSYYLSVNEFFTTHFNAEQLIHINRNIGAIFLELDQLDSAEYYYKTSYELAQNGFGDFIPELTANFGFIEKERGNLGLAKKNYRRALVQFISNEDKLGEVSAKLGLAEIAYDEAAYDSAQLLAGAAINLAQIHSIHNFVVEGKVLLKKVYDKMGMKRESNQLATQIALLEEKNYANEKAIQKELILATLHKYNQHTEKNQQQLTTSESSSLFHFKHLWILILFSIAGGGLLLLVVNKRKRNQSATLSRLRNEEIEELKSRLDNSLARERHYLNSDLSLGSLAALLDTSDKNLSCLLNLHLHTNFYDFINEYRVKAFQEKLESGRYHNYSLTGIALESGFKSKSSFYRAFKKHTGVTPKEYQNSLKGK